MYRSYKNIGVYGDSFTGGGIDTVAKENHWSSLLQKHFNCELTNYGAAGSSIYYSYVKFKKNFHKHDLNIFLITEPSRYPSVVNVSGNELHFPNLSTLDWFDENDFIQPRKNDLIGWYLASDPTYLEEMASLMIDKVSKLDTECLIIPSFPNLPQEILDIISADTPRLYELYDHQCKLLDIDGVEFATKYKENFEIMIGHLVPEYNQLVFDCIKHKLDTGVWENNIPLPDKLAYTIEQLYIKR